MSDKKTVKSGDVVRVTGVFPIGDKTYHPNTLVKNLPEAVLQVQLEVGHLSADPAGIKYCKEKLKAEVVDHTAKPEEEKAEK